MLNWESFKLMLIDSAILLGKEGEANILAILISNICFRFKFKFPVKDFLVNFEEILKSPKAPKTIILIFISMA